MTFNEKKISVCIPVYNGEKFIRETIQSVLDQSYANFEIIITDDCSEDSTAEIVHSIDDSRISYYCNSERKGLTGNWNEAVKKATGKYFKLLCQDDILFPDALQNQINAISEYEDICCVIGNTDVIDSSGKRIIKRERFKQKKVYSGARFAKKSFRGRNIYCEPGNVLYRTQLFYEYGPYSPEFKYTPDWDFAVASSLNGKICCISDYIMSFRISDCSETSRLYKAKIKDLIIDTDKLIEKYRDEKKLRLNKADVLFFKFVIRIFCFLRLLVLRINK